MQVQVIHTAFEDTPSVVAMVEVGDRKGMDALEHAYVKTQNMLGSWSFGPTVEWDGETHTNVDYSEDVTVMADHPVSKRTGEKMGLRSTSVGDQLVLGNKKYTISDVAFEEVK